MVMRRVGFGCLGSLVFYFVGAFGGGFLITVLSSNTHDKGMEAAMTGGFVIGPIAAFLGGILGAVFTPGTRNPSDDQAANSSALNRRSNET